MKQDSISAYIQCNLRLRQYFYKSNSNLPTLILLITVKFFEANKELSFKQMKNTLFFSENALRNSLSRLKQEKLIHIVLSKTDRRNKLIIPSHILLEKYEKYLEIDNAKKKK